MPLIANPSMRKHTVLKVDSSILIANSYYFIIKIMFACSHVFLENEKSVGMSKDQTLILPFNHPVFYHLSYTSFALFLYIDNLTQTLSLALTQSV